MRMKKKLSFILLSILILSMLVACESGDDIVKNQMNEKEDVEVLDEDELVDLKLREFESDKIDFDITYLPSDEERDEKLEKIIKEYLDYDKEKMGEIKYFHHPVTLNDKYENLSYVYLLGDYVAGSGGGTALIIDKDEDAVLFEFTQVDNPVVISEETTNDWNDIIMRTKEGFAKMSFDGEKYPSNPTVEEHIEEGEISGFGVVAEEIEPEYGHILE